MEQRVGPDFKRTLRSVKMLPELDQEQLFLTLKEKFDRGGRPTGKAAVGAEMKAIPVRTEEDPQPENLETVEVAGETLEGKWGAFAEVPEDVADRATWQVDEAEGIEAILKIESPLLRVDCPALFEKHFEVFSAHRSGNEALIPRVRLTIAYRELVDIRTDDGAQEEPDAEFFEAESFDPAFSGVVAKRLGEMDMRGEGQRGIDYAQKVAEIRAKTLNLKKDEHVELQEDELAVLYGLIKMPFLPSRILDFAEEQLLPVRQERFENEDSKKADLEVLARLIRASIEKQAASESDGSALQRFGEIAGRLDELELYKTIPREMFARSFQESDEVWAKSGAYEVVAAEYMKQALTEFYSWTPMLNATPNLTIDFKQLIGIGTEKGLPHYPRKMLKHFDGRALSGKIAGAGSVRFSIIMQNAREDSRSLSDIRQDIYTQGKGEHRVDAYLPAPLELLVMSGSERFSRGQAWIDYTGISGLSYKEDSLAIGFQNQLIKPDTVSLLPARIKGSDRGIFALR